jgi:hypothetical protein
MQIIRRVLAVLFVLGSFGFLLMVGYTLKVMIRDFGLGAGLLGLACVAIGGIALGFLHDTRPHREP